MPICKREGFENFSKSPKEATFHDKEEVFYCETTKQIFRDYEEYFRHVMVINSTIWQCEATNRENLTYAEALKSERRARKKLEQFKESLRPVVLLVIEKAQQSSIKTLSNMVYSFIRSRFFRNEPVDAIHNITKHEKHVVVDVVAEPKSPPDNGVYDPAMVMYKLKRVGGPNNGKECVVPAENVRRGRNEFSHDNLKMFIKDNIIRVQGILRPKPESYKKYLTDKKLNLAKLFIGKMPHYEPSKPSNRSTDGDKKQASMAKYVTKNGKTEKPPAESEAVKAERINSLKSEMERVRKEKEAKQAEHERKKAERLAKIEEEASVLAKKSDDLIRFDQKRMPKYEAIKTQIPNKYLGDCLMVQEFMHSFVGILSGINAFKNNISFFELTRAFTVREVSGPLSDIILILLSTIFDLQQEEETECAVEYASAKNQHREPYTSIGRATRAQEYVRRHYARKLNQLPLDALSVSEALRLHLLCSGAHVSEKAERWRYTYRNGYYSVEDPGLMFRLQYPHVLRSLQLYSVFQLPMVEIIRIINTLVAQILTYSSTISIIDERMELAAKSKQDLRTLLAVENRRIAKVEADRKKLVLDYAALAKEQPDQSAQLEETLNKKVAELLAISTRDKKKFDNQLDKLNSGLFDYMVFLGMDRAYRKYYVLESMAGVFIEHPDDIHDVCLQTPPTNVPHLVGCPSKLKQIRSHLSKLYPEEEDPEKRKRRTQAQIAKDKEMKEKEMKDKETKDKENKENKENEAVLNGDVVVNGTAPTKMEVDGEVDNNEMALPIPEPVIPEVPPTQYELLMCTGDPENCIVHDSKNPDRQRWAYLYKEEDVDELIACLNPLGERESALKEQLTSMRALIVNHVKNCPSEMLSLDSGNRRLSRFKVNLREDTRKKYSAANYGFPENTDLSEVMHAMLVDRILKFEFDISSGNLGDIKVDDIEKWRSDVQNNCYDSQGQLIWGYDPDARPYKDPGEFLGDTLEVESEDSSDEGISLHDSPTLKEAVQSLASALLQVEQGIEKRFLKEPFGITKETKDKEKMDTAMEKGRYRLNHWEESLMHSLNYSQVFLHLNILHNAIKWQRSTNKSSCQICHRMTDPEKMLLCDECNAGTHMFCMKPKMKIVPEGNWYCRRCVTKLGLTNEPKEKKKAPRKRAFVLEEEDNASVGSSRSNRSAGLRQNKLRAEDIEEELCNDDDDVEDEDDEEVVDEEEEVEEEEEVIEEEEVEEEEEVIEEEVEGEEEEDDEVDDSKDPLANGDHDDTIDEDDEICQVCSYNGGEIACNGCKSVYHLDCVDLKRPPRSNWNCSSCKANTSKKRKSIKNDDLTDDEEYDQPLKRPRQSNGSKRHVRNSINDNGSDEVIRTNNNNSRRSRRTGDHLPLNSPILYDLLDDIMKHDSSWPFLRPVSHSEVPDYHTIIKEPMDFAKVKSKLNMGKYTINEELLKDIELVFKNCDIYNQEGNEIYEAGSTLEKFVVERCKDLHLPFQPSDMNRASID